MAKFTPSGLIQDIKGSIGSFTYANWKGLHTIRMKAASISNPVTFAQIGIRSTLVDSARRWFALTQEQRDLWNEYAQTLGSARSKEKQEGYGGIIPLGGALMTGFNAFVGTNQVLSSTKFSPVDVPPLPPYPPSPVIDSVVFTTGLAVHFSTSADIGGIKKDSKVQAWIELIGRGSHVYVAEISSIQSSPDPLDWATNLSTCRVGHDRNIGMVTWLAAFGAKTTGPYSGRQIARVQGRIIDGDGGISSSTNVQTIIYP